MEIQSPEIKELAAALAQVQGELSPAQKTAENPFFKSKYADMAAIWEACQAPLAKHGFSCPQVIVKDELITTLLHSSGQWIRSVVDLKPAKSDPQSFGSCVTYMRRYAKAALVGVVTEDDDGNAASEADKKKKPDLSMAMDRAQAEQVHEEALKKLNAAADLGALQTIWTPYQKTIKSLPEDLAADLIQKKDEIKAEFSRNLNGAH